MCVWVVGVGGGVGVGAAQSRACVCGRVGATRCVIVLRLRGRRPALQGGARLHCSGRHTSVMLALPHQHVAARCAVLQTRWPAPT